MANQIVSYYGAPVNFGNTTHGIRILINIYVSDIGIIDFQSTDDAIPWEKEYKDIKTTAYFAHIYIDINQMSLIQKIFFCHRVYSSNGGLCRVVGTRDGARRSLFSINNIRINIGMPLISWPDGHYIDEHGSLQTPNNTDDFGQGI